MLYILLRTLLHTPSAVLPIQVHLAFSGSLLGFVEFSNVSIDIVNISWHIFLKDITDYAASSKSS